jgi:nucleoid-associated protein YgaU
MGFLDRLFGKKQQPAGPMKEYRTMPGDTLKSVARKEYGDESKWQLLYETNKRILEEANADPNTEIYPGTVLKIPPVQ